MGYYGIFEKQIPIRVWCPQLLMRLHRESNATITGRPMPTYPASPDPLKYDRLAPPGSLFSQLSKDTCICYYRQPLKLPLVLAGIV